jgi:hypothetical protein
MLKMFFKFFISCIIPLFLLSCEKNDTEIPSSKGIMSFYDNIKNKEGIDINGLDGVNANEPDELASSHAIECAHGDTVVLWGFRNNKIWISFFDKETKKQLIEWNSVEDIKRNIKIDKGYGEFEKVYLDKFSILSLIYMPFGFLGRCSYEYKNDRIIKDWILLNKDKLVYIDTTIDDKTYQPNYFKLWYNNSIILDSHSHLYERDHYIIIITNQGETICRLKEKIHSDCQPLSYTDGIYVCRDFGDMYIIRHNYQTGKDVWKTSIPSLKGVEDNARINSTILEQSNPIWKYQIDITNYDGSKKQVIFTVDVETGKVTEI